MLTPPPLTPNTSGEVWGETLPEAFRHPAARSNTRGGKGPWERQCHKRRVWRRKRWDKRIYHPTPHTMHTHPCPLAISQTAGSTEHGESFHQQYWHCLGERSDSRDRKARYISQINTSPAPAGDIPTRGCQLQPPSLQVSQAQGEAAKQQVSPVLVGDMLPPLFGLPALPPSSPP